MSLQKGLRKKKTSSANGNLAKESPEKKSLPEISLWNIIGVLMCMACGGLYVYIISQAHEATMFFTGITDVEREISFRTENGLYYSYYKQLVDAPSYLWEVHNLTKDRLTEHPSTINVLARMNVYQEVALAAAYRFLPFVSTWMEPIFFYIYFVFVLHGILVSSLFLMTWIISGTWLAGCLTALFYLVNSGDTTRVDSYMPLRENFSLPCLWLQLLLITVYFKYDLNEKRARLCERGLMVFTFFFALMWQFNQFALLLQAMALFGCQVLDVVDKRKILHMHICLLSSMLLVSMLQFFNTMILSGFLISFLLASIIIIKIEERYQTSGSFYVKVAFLILNVVSVFALAASINSLLKIVFRQEADEHINRFVMSKFGFNSVIDFDVRLYLCNGGFVFLSWDFFQRVSSNLLFPLYILSHVVLLALLYKRTLRVLESSALTKEKQELLYSLPPELAYHCIQVVFFGAVGIMAMRMKYFWTPYMCIFASACLFKSEPWFWLADKVFKYSGHKLIKVLHMAIGMALISYLASKTYGDYRDRMDNLGEFYDPDTVELMGWINANTSSTSSFSGSMQLLAAVKLSTGRPITNHPHYEDKSLRLKTKEIYKYYGRYSAEEVHITLRKHQTDFIILEDSICLVPLRDGCGLPYIMDMEAGLELDKTGKPLKNDVLPRFCDRVRHEEEPYSTLFKLVMRNKTFRIYQVL